MWKKESMTISWDLLDSELDSSLDEEKKNLCLIADIEERVKFKPFFDFLIAFDSSCSTSYNEDECDLSYMDILNNYNFFFSNI